jgi:hypothetical protein
LVGRALILSLPLSWLNPAREDGLFSGVGPTDPPPRSEETGCNIIRCARVLRTDGLFADASLTLIGLL